MSIDLNSKVIQFAEHVKKATKIDSKTGSAPPVEGVFIDNLPANLTKELIEEYEEYKTVAAAGTTLALGELSIPIMKKNKELERTNIILPTTGKNTLSVEFTKSRQVPFKNADGTSGLRPSYGSTHTQYNEYSDKSVGDLSKVKKILSAKADMELGVHGK